MPSARRAAAVIFAFDGMKTRPSLFTPPDRLLGLSAAINKAFTGLAGMLTRKPTVMLACLLACLALLSSCHDDGGYYGLEVTIDRSACPDVPIDSLMVCIHSADGRLVAERRFGGGDGYTTVLYPVGGGCYTVSAVANWPADDSPIAGMSRPALTQWLTRAAAADPAHVRLYGRATACVADGGTTAVTVSLSSEPVTLPVLRLTAVLPDDSLPPYDQATRSGGAYKRRRLVVEAVIAATGETVARLDTVATEWADEGLDVELTLDEGLYDIQLWSDCGPSADGNPPLYDATDLDRVTLATGYAGGPADRKDAASAVLTAVSVTADGADATANLKRPVAKYVLVADDVDDFLKSSGTRQLSQLTATVECEGFFPSAYNVAGDRPCDSSTGYAYSCRLSPDGLTDGALPIAADWVMVNGDESYVNLTVTITDGEGRLVARRRGVTVPYRRGCLTTVSGHFLTAGGGSSGIGLDHDWADDTFVVEF